MVVVVATATAVVVADAVDWWKRLRMLLLPGFCSAPEKSLLGKGLQIDLELFWHAPLIFLTRLRGVLQGLG